MTGSPEGNSEAEVIEAFRAAEKAGCSLVKCYSAAVATWQRNHPQSPPEHAAVQAVDVVFRGRENLLLAVE
jgi:hypothetical protein